ncbi:hypothetical protein COCON_G00054280 [Conger conger]|uniref:Uncharacterized protein n=1 Tax=Conger conger TaxID=82655 RepID=A0A9Q1DWJ6_CONCO|nr:hypothetical protein COCON_G00054280 [Conger conger]
MQTRHIIQQDTIMKATVSLLLLILTITKALGGYQQFKDQHHSFDMRTGNSEIHPRPDIIQQDTIMKATVSLLFLTLTITSTVIAQNQYQRFMAQHYLHGMRSGDFTLTPPLFRSTSITLFSPSLITTLRLGHVGALSSQRPFPRDHRGLVPVTY